MLDAAAIAELADRVDGAQSNRRTIAKLTDDYPGMTVDDGYAVQDECLRRWQARGRALIGYKAGLTSRAKMIQMGVDVPRSEEHTSELQSLMRISYAVFCLKKKNIHATNNTSKLEPQ